VVLPVAIFLLAAPGLGIGDSPLGRVGEIVSPAGSAANRVEIWKSSLEMIKDRPLLGSGPDTFLLEFPRHQTADYVRGNEAGAIADNAHNYPLELATGVGLPATLIFLAMAAMAVRMGLRDRAGAYRAALAAGTAGYLVHLMFGVSDLTTTAFMWGAMGLIVSGQERESRISVGTMPGRAIAAVLAVVWVAAAVISVKVVSGDAHYLEALKTGGFQPAYALEQLDKAVGVNGAWPIYHQEGAVLLIDSFQQTGDGRYLDRAIDLLSEAERSHPRDVETRLLLAEIYLNTAASNEQYQRAVYQLEAVLEREPRSFRALALLGEVELNLDNPQSALDYLTKSLDLRPSDPTALALMGNYFRLAGQASEARDMYLKTLEVDPGNPRAIDGLRRL
jgi:tetratricopeptide (TPR) repeat protein